jgi:hypothetical protein
MFGKRPTTPKRTAVKIVAPDANHALQNDSPAMKNLVRSKATTVKSGRTNNTGFAR